MDGSTDEVDTGKEKTCLIGRLVWFERLNVSITLGRFTSLHLSLQDYNLAPIDYKQAWNLKLPQLTGHYVCKATHVSIQTITIEVLT